MAKRRPETIAEWLDHFEAKRQKAFDTYQETGEARYDSQSNKYAIICDGLMALLREKDDRDTKLQRRIQNKSAAVDKLIKDTYTKDEVVKIMNAAVYW